MKKQIKVTEEIITELGGTKITKYLLSIEVQKTIHIKGIGSITSEGELNLEASIKSLLKNKYITG